MEGATLIAHNVITEDHFGRVAEDREAKYRALHPLEERAACAWREILGKGVKRVCPLMVLKVHSIK